MMVSRVTHKPFATLLLQITQLKTIKYAAYTTNEIMDPTRRALFSVTSRAY